MTSQTTSTQTGITVSTAITAGGPEFNHAEGIVVSTPITAGGIQFNHAEGIVVSTPITAGGIQFNHAEGIVASTPNTTRCDRRRAGARAARPRFEMTRITRNASIAALATVTVAALAPSVATANVSVTSAERPPSGGAQDQEPPAGPVGFEVHIAATEDQAEAKAKLIKRRYKIVYQGG